MVGRRHEIDAVGIGLDRRGAERRQAIEDRRDDGPALGRHAVGGREVVPVPAVEREVAVERVDEDLEGLLEGAEVRALGGVRRLAGQPLGVHPELAQALEERREDAERVGGRSDRPRQHDRGIERRDVHVERRPRHTFLEDRGVAAADRPDGSWQRHRVATVEVFA